MGISIGEVRTGVADSGVRTLSVVRSLFTSSAVSPPRTGSIGVRREVDGGGLSVGNRSKSSSFGPFGSDAVMEMPSVEALAPKKLGNCLLSCFLDLSFGWGFASLWGGDSARSSSPNSASLGASVIPTKAEEEGRTHVAVSTGKSGS